MTYCKQGEIWFCDENMYIILSDDRYNKRLGCSMCMRVVEGLETTRNLDVYVPIYSRSIRDDLWVDVSSICSLRNLEYRVCRVSKMSQVREILHSFSRLFGTMCYVPAFGFHPSEYNTTVEEETVEEVKKPKATTQKDGGWKTVSYKKHRK